MAHEIAREDNRVEIGDAAEWIFLFYSIFVAILIGVGVIRTVDFSIGWATYAVLVIVAFVVWLITAGQGVTNMPWSFLGCLYNISPWMKDRQPRLLISIAASFVALFGQVGLLMVSDPSWFLAGTAIVGLVIIPHAGLLSKKRD